MVAASAGKVPKAIKGYGGRVNRYRPLSAVLAVLVAALAVALPAGPAQAHTELSRTTPAAKSTVTKPVTAVTLTFSGLVKKPGTTVAVTGPDKASYSDSAAEVLDKTITQKVKPLPVGTITVAWRTVASDGHPLQGSFTFTNRAAPPTPSAEPTPTADAVTTSAPATPAGQTPTPASAASDDDSSTTIWWLAGAALILVLALLGGLLWRRRRPQTP
jgi:copper resistance protein C